MKRKISIFLVLLIIVFMVPSLYRLLVAKVSGYPILSDEDKDRLTFITSLDEIDLNHYNSYVNEDQYFRFTLYMQKESPKKYRHISIFSTLEYIGNKDLITIWSGNPYYGYTVKNSEGEYFVQWFVDDEEIVTEIVKGDIVVLPFLKNIGFSSDDPKALYWETYGKDPYFRLPTGKYELTATTLFSLSEKYKEYDNEIVIDFEVTK